MILAAAPCVALAVVALAWRGLPNAGALAPPVLPNVGEPAPVAAARVPVRLAQPGVVELRVAADADTTLVSSQPSHVGGAETTLQMGHQAGSELANYDVLVHFPLSGLPPGATVVSATLELQQIEADGQATVAARLAPLTEAWDESSASWSVRPAAGVDTNMTYVSSEIGRVAIDATAAVRVLQVEGRNFGLQLAVSGDSGCEAGRSRTFTSREAGSQTGMAPPSLVLYYVGPGTPHPFPSATPSPTRTSTLTPTGTLPPTHTPTPTSNRPDPGMPVPLEPVPHAELFPPVGSDRWVFRWRWPAFTPFCQDITLVLTDPNGQRTTQRERFTTCITYVVDRPLPATSYGPWTWEIQAICAPVGGGTISPQPFTVRPRPSSIPNGEQTHTPTATATASAAPSPPVWRLALPRVEREGEAR